MSVFDQKMSLGSSVRRWFGSGGWSNYAATEHFFCLLREEFNTPKSGDLNQTHVASRLLPLRDDLRRIMQLPQSVRVLQRGMKDINPLIRAISVWLLSKHANRFLLLGIETTQSDYSPLVRKRTARALRKLEARELLAEMASEYPEDEALQWYATFTANPKTHRERLEKYVASVRSPDAIPNANESPIPLWFRDEYWSGSPPKSVQYIREILWRIRRLVRE